MPAIIVSLPARPAVSLSGRTDIEVRTIQRMASQAVGFRCVHRGWGHRASKGIDTAGHRLEMVRPNTGASPAEMVELARRNYIIGQEIGASVGQPVLSVPGELAVAVPICSADPDPAVIGPIYLRPEPVRQG